MTGGGQEIAMLDDWIKGRRQSADSTGIHGQWTYDGGGVCAFELALNLPARTSRPSF